jgi:hypothetical protein
VIGTTVGRVLVARIIRAPSLPQPSKYRGEIDGERDDQHGDDDHEQHGVQERHRSLFRAIFPTSRMMSRSDSSAAFSFSNCSGGR